MTTTRYARDKGTFYIVCLLLIVFTGCAGSPVRSYTHPNADLLSVKRVALLPFKNLSGAPEADEKIRAMFLANILSAGHFDVVEAGEMNRLLREMKIDNPHDMDSETLRSFGANLGIQGAIYGTIEEYRTSVSTGSGTYPEVALSVRLVDVESNIVMWMSSNSRGGSATVSFMGIGETPYISELSQKVVADIVDSLNISASGR